MPVPINDLCANAIDLGSTLPVATITVDTTEATDETPGFFCRDYNGVWYKFTVPANVHRLQVNSFDPDFLGQVISVLRGTLTGTCTDFEGFDFETIACINFDDYSTFDVVPGETIYILLSSDDPGGIAEYRFSIERARPTGDVCLTIPILSPVRPVPPPTSPGPKDCDPVPEQGNGGKGASGCNEGGVGVVPSYPLTAAFGAVPQHDDPTDGELLTGKSELDVWVELYHVDQDDTLTVYRRALAELGDA